MDTLLEMLDRVMELPAAALRPGAGERLRQPELELLSPLLPQASFDETIIRRGCIERQGRREVRVRLLNGRVHDLTILRQHDQAIVMHNGARVHIDTVAEFREYATSLCEAAEKPKASA